MILRSPPSLLDQLVVSLPWTGDDVISELQQFSLLPEEKGDLGSFRVAGAYRIKNYTVFPSAYLPILIHVVDAIIHQRAEALSDSLSFRAQDKLQQGRNQSHARR